MSSEDAIMNRLIINSHKFYNGWKYSMLGFEYLMYFGKGVAITVIFLFNVKLSQAFAYHIKAGLIYR